MKHKPQLHLLPQPQTTAARRLPELQNEVPFLRFKVAVGTNYFISKETELTLVPTLIEFCSYSQLRWRAFEWKSYYYDYDHMHACLNSDPCKCFHARKHVGFETASGLN